MICGPFGTGNIVYIIMHASQYTVNESVSYININDPKL